MTSICSRQSSRGKFTPCIILVDCAGKIHNQSQGHAFHKSHPHAADLYISIGHRFFALIFAIDFNREVKVYNKYAKKIYCCRSAGADNCLIGGVCSSYQSSGADCFPGPCPVSVYQAPALMVFTITALASRVNREQCCSVGTRVFVRWIYYYFFMLAWIQNEVCPSISIIWCRFVWWISLQLSDHFSAAV